MTSPDKIKKFVVRYYPRLGVNKNREITRLLWEISKRENIDFKTIIPRGLNFFNLKKKLLKRRFPEATSNNEKINPCLLDIKIDLDNKADIKKDSRFQPLNIYYEKSVAQSEILQKFKRNKIFHRSNFKEIPSLKIFIKQSCFSIKNYNKRRDNLFIINEKYDFFKRCPCSTKCVCCGYYIFNIGFGCPYECTYCYLQEYTNSPGIIIPANLNNYFDVLNRWTKKPIRIGTGEWTDSLALDCITEFSPQLIEFFRCHPMITLELKTKSDNIENIIKTEPVDNVVISWSLNPQKFIEKNEFYTSDLKSRLSAAEKCVDAGYDVAFHFDPIVPYSGWENDYREVIDHLFDNIDGDRIRWISLGTFRFSRKLKKIIENRFPFSDILDGELMVGFDGKLRYSEKKRTEIYKKMIEWIKKRSRRPFLYLCMENKKVWGKKDTIDSVPLSSDWRWQGIGISGADIKKFDL